MNIDLLNSLQIASLVDDLEGNGNSYPNCSKSANHPVNNPDYPFSPSITIIAGTL